MLLRSQRLEDKTANSNNTWNFLSHDNGPIFKLNVDSEIKAQKE